MLQHSRHGWNLPNKVVNAIVSVLATDKQQVHVSQLHSECGGVILNYPALSNYNGTWQGDGTGGSTKGSANGDGSFHVNGQTGVTSGIGGEWPFIQTFDFTIETFDVRLEQAGADEVVTLDYDNSDLDDYASIDIR